MANVFDYLDWRGDVSLSADPFNEVDNLVLSLLVYTDFRGLVPRDGAPVPLKTVREAFFRAHSRQAVRADKSFVAQAAFLMDGMVSGARFGETKLCGFMDEIDQEKEAQISALTFLLPDGSVFVAFRGTDSSLVGWKEDFNFIYLSETEGQRRAVRYLNEAAQTLQGPLRVGGHSKGGNLAVFAASFCQESAQDRIQAVYSNDGPGFRQDVLCSPGHLRVLPRIVSLIPDTAIVGLLLTSRAPNRVIKSAASGILQHDGFSWMIRRNGFVKTELTAASRVIDRALDDWLEQMDDETRRFFVNTIFSLFESTGMNTISEIGRKKWKSMRAMIERIRRMPREKQREAMRILGMLTEIGSQAVADHMAARPNQLAADSSSGRLPP